MTTLAAFLVRSDPGHLGRAPANIFRLAQTSAAEPSIIQTPQVILSFDVEEHFRIEAAKGLPLNASLRAHYCNRLESSTRWLLDQLAGRGLYATFFIVGQVAQHNARLIRDIHGAGHEIASHGWDHERIHNFSPTSFREDVRKSKDALEQVTGEEVVGYRAPTFSIVRQTAWAVDELVEQGIQYDSSVYPVKHDRYGVPRAPRVPFRARGLRHEILEIPPATLRLLGINVPVGGGGYFRLLPLFLLEYALRQVGRTCEPPVAMLYFHPWEFDPEQTRLPLRALNRFRTYVGLTRSRARLGTLLQQHRFARAMDVAQQLKHLRLPQFALAS